MEAQFPRGEKVLSLIAARQKHSTCPSSRSAYVPRVQSKQDSELPIATSVDKLCGLQYLHMVNIIFIYPHPVISLAKRYNVEPTNLCIKC